jgi:hypothetical protein
MNFAGANIEYVVRNVENLRLVWLKNLNRYIQFEEPAFFVFQQLAEGLASEEISRELEITYNISGPEAKRFTDEIREGIETLYLEYKAPGDPVLKSTARLPAFRSRFEKYIKVAGKTIRFSFGDSRLEEYFFPVFNYLEIHPGPVKSDLHAEFLQKGGKAYMRINEQEVYAWPLNLAYRMKGELFMQMLNLIHGDLRGEWMGVIHASSVSLGKNAVMFPAQSGGGKSTLASLLLARGCKLLSDDFTPLTLDKGQIRPFPGSISLKPGSWKLLESYFPELKETEGSPSPSKEASVKYLKAAQPPFREKEGFHVCAIVFVQYTPQLECKLDRISNLSALNDFLTESWLPNETRVSEKFLDWFLDIPCYTLKYGNNRKGIQSIQKLLQDVP